MGREKGQGIADLHVHTTYSDGMFSPEKVVEKAVQLGLKVIAVTDHDCVGGIAPTMRAAKGTGVEVVPGVEISAAKGEKEIHILGYFMDHKNRRLLETFERLRRNRERRMRKMVRLLSGKGIDIPAEDALAMAEKGTVGRLHLARLMLERNAVRDLNEAFDRYIGDGKPCHVKHERLDYRKAIDLIKKAGGVPVLAHPATMGGDEDIPDLVEAGLRGLEVYHTKHRPSANDRYLKIAEKMGLLVTGGSDCHGMGPGKILIGKVRVGYDVVEALRGESEKIRNLTRGDKKRKGRARTA